MNTSLLGQLAGKFAAQDEVVATEALTLVLRRSDAARAGLAQVLQHAGGALKVVTGVSAQEAAPDTGRPDLAVFDAPGSLAALLEAKFGAPLMPTQPVKYLERLSSRPGAVLLFVAPRDRLDSLWWALLERVRAAGAASELRPASEEFRSAACGGVSLALVSWRRLLAVLTAACGGADDRRGQADLEQLAGLVERYQSEGFDALSSFDLTDLTVPRRVRSLARLTQALVARAEAEKVLPTGKGNPYSFSFTWAGRTFRIGRASTWFGVHHDAWARFQVSPLWVTFLANEYGCAPIVRRALQDWELSEPKRMFVDEDNGAVYVPLFVRTGVESEEMVADLLRQLAALIEILTPALA